MRHTDSTDGSEQPPGRQGMADPGEPAVDGLAAERSEAVTAEPASATAGTGGAEGAAARDTTTRIMEKADPGQPDGHEEAAGAQQPKGRTRTPRLHVVLDPLTRALRQLSSILGLNRASTVRGTARPAGAGRTGGAAAGAGARVRPGEAAGSALARITALPAILLVAWLIPGLPLLLGKSFLPVPMLLISVPLAAALGVNALREVPVSWPRPGRADRPASGWTTWFGLLGTVAVVAGLIAWQLRESSQSLIVLRDAGTYLQAGYWIAQHGLVPIPKQIAAFGGSHPGLLFASNGFPGRGGSLFPAVMPGMPMLLAAGFWVHGVAGAAAVGPILGGLAALSFAGLVARLVGPQWAPVGALLLGLCLPQQYISRSTLSETALQVLLFGALCMLGDALLLRRSRAARPAAGPGEHKDVPRPAVSAQGEAAQGDTVPDAAAPDAAVPGDDAQGNGPRPKRAAQLAGIGQARAARLRDMARSVDWSTWLSPERVLSCLAGLALGLSLLVTLDGLIYLLPVIPFGVVLLVGRRSEAIPFLAGFAVGGAYGLAGAFLLDRPFLDSVGPTVAISGVAAVWLLALSVVAGQLSRLPSLRRVVPRLLKKVPLRWLPELGGLLAAAALIGFAIRPYVQVVHGRPSASVAHFIASLQRLQGLPVDPTRLYSEQTLYWVIWYIGLPTVILGGVGLAAVVRNCLHALLTWRDPRGRWRIWGLPVAIICVGTGIVLWYPDIVPDQPWASRRLVVMVLPGLIICALWAAEWLATRARSRGAHVVTAAVVGLFCSAAMLVPTVATTFGIGISHGGQAGGLRAVAQGMALQRTGAGESSAVSSLCAQIPRKASVLIVDPAMASQFSQVIRGMCGVPVAWMADWPASAVDAVVQGIASAGRQPVLLAGSSQRLAAFGGSPVQVLNLSTNGDPEELTQLPTTPAKLHFEVWLTLPPASGAGA